MVHLEDTLTCGAWDCDCTFNRLRGCCCAANDLFRVEDETFRRLASLGDGITVLRGRVGALTAGIKIAFKAGIDPYLLTTSDEKCFGPFNTNVPIPYTLVTLNDGNGYNPSLGVFTAPHAGVYVFSCTVYSVVNLNQRLYHNVVMVKNGEVLTSVWEDNREDGEDSGSHALTVEMQRGDQVYMELESGRKLCTNLYSNVFTGYMLYAYTDE
ncbi:cerebellin 18 [Entelurus aequoreus]|uniref:cerebellin 18 n=1 Tax=Entelurus aequoreus TaxID=161455 RepID=UPI002B1DFCB1|nr:cerebellin 18 [Entelurus aequoreus]